MKFAACTAGTGIIALGKPIPLKHMTRHQWRRYHIEVRRWQRAGIAWGLGCGIQGPVLAAGIIALDDFVSRFVTREIPIKRTPRQEQLLFCRDGSAPCPNLSGPDPDMYGPAYPTRAKRHIKRTPRTGKRHRRRHR